jgi:hypothetical protein
VEYKGGKYLFASTGNRDAFKAAPEKYLPNMVGIVLSEFTKERNSTSIPHHGALWTANSISI